MSRNFVPRSERIEREEFSASCLWKRNAARVVQWISHDCHAERGL